MKKLVPVLFVVTYLFSSCNKEVAQPTKEEIQLAIDSIAAARIKDMDAREQKDLEYRMKIELKARIDSVNNAREMQRAKADTVTAATTPAASNN